MLFAVDIDQTICGSNAHEVYAHFHNQDLDLHIEPTVLNQLTSYRDFFFLPRVVSFRQAHAQEWNASRHRAIATPSVLDAFLPIKDAVSGIELLSSYGDVRYYTARTPEVREVTQSWLARYHFVHSQHVFCCESIEQKALALADHKPNDESIVLVDDRGHSHFMAMLERMKEKQCVRELLQRFTIFAFGVRAIPETSLCPVLALPCWNDLGVALHALQSR